MQYYNRGNLRKNIKLILDLNTAQKCTQVEMS